MNKEARWSLILVVALISCGEQGVSVNSSQSEEVESGLRLEGEDHFAALCGSLRLVVIMPKRIGHLPMINWCFKPTTQAGGRVVIKSLFCNWMTISRHPLRRHHKFPMA